MNLAGPKKRRPKGPFILALVIALIVGALFLFSSMASEEPVQTIEEEVVLGGDVQ
ncbi:hypothetical protein [Sphingomicrobium astaxanthinifaciens]|uniref:hypothetical protein n=1 Tax=Sphingomicrobium astaxanthinifaciens TaxID=1227949 RepID=UPI001FCAB900|nr:hypothetical protein [Sphingomicrobium astaxanthinifaciens]MCJ7420628.1 hypothetical protein [Sphingomicrobium astaxanthinifaciens]